MTAETEVFINPSRVDIQNDKFLIHDSVTDHTEGFNVRLYDMKVSLTPKAALPEGILFTSNTECEVLYIKKRGRWYATYNFGHHKATNNPDTWTHEDHVTDEWVRQHCYELKPQPIDQ